MSTTRSEPARVPLPSWLTGIYALFESAGHELYLVGGAVRDLLLGTPLEAQPDLDFATSARPEQTLEILKGGGLKVFDVGKAFGTVGTLLPQGDGADAEATSVDVQVTTYRTEEVYRRGSRHPTVRYGDTLDEDLARRDLSINSIALAGDGRIVDPFDGRGDLQRGILRVIGEPETILEDDPLRILRLARFLARFGFAVDPPAEAATRTLAHELLLISAERWQQELGKLICARHAAQALRFCLRTRVLDVLLPELAMVAERDLTRFEAGLERLGRVPAKLAIRYAALLRDLGRTWTEALNEKLAALLAEGALRRLKVDAGTRRDVERLLRAQGLIAELSADAPEAELRTFVVRSGALLDDALALALADQPQEAPRLEALRERVVALREALSSEDLALPTGIGKAIMRRFSLPPGPDIGRIRKGLEQALVEGRISPGLGVDEYLDAAQALGIVDPSAAG